MINVVSFNAHNIDTYFRDTGYTFTDDLNYFFAAFSFELPNQGAFSSVITNNIYFYISGIQSISIHVGQRLDVLTSHVFTVSDSSGQGINISVDTKPFLWLPCRFYNVIIYYDRVNRVNSYVFVNGIRLSFTVTAVTSAISTGLNQIGIRYQGSGNASFLAFSNLWMHSYTDENLTISNPNFAENFFDRETGLPIEIPGTGVVNGILPLVYNKADNLNPRRNSAAGRNMTFDSTSQPVAGNSIVAFTADQRHLSCYHDLRLSPFMKKNLARSAVCTHSTATHIPLITWTTNPTTATYERKALIGFWLFAPSAAATTATFLNKIFTASSRYVQIICGNTNVAGWVQFRNQTGLFGALTCPYFQTRPLSTNRMSWNFFLMYYDFDDAETSQHFGYCIKNNLTRVDMVPTPLATLPTVATGYNTRIALSGAVGLSGYIYYGRDIIEANPGIDWVNLESLRDRFVNIKSGSPKYGGHTGSEYLGVTPTYYLNAALGIGFHSSLLGSVTNFEGTNTFPAYSWFSPYPGLMNTRNDTVHYENEINWNY